jgi:hypothetical protein
MIRLVLADRKNEPRRAQMKKTILAVTAVVLTTLSACDSGTWVNVPGIAGGCKGGKPNGLGMKGPEDVKIFAEGLCLVQQKNYAGEFQCKGEDLQVRCK